VGAAPYPAKIRPNRRASCSELGRGEKMSLRGTYAYSVDMAQKMGLSNIEERDGKLHFKGTVATQADANKIWDAIKTIPTWSKDIVADIQARPGGGGQTYTVKAGDTLSKIAKELLGDAGAYNAIFEANRDQLTDPDKIQPGQTLKIPVK
jgi:nucleoid-associated protein YgaU